MQAVWQEESGVLYCGDSRRLPLADGSVNLIVTSPPYGTMKFGYRLPGYLEMLRAVLMECVRVLAPDGKLCLNVNNYVTRKQEEGARYVVPITRHVQEWLEPLLVYQDEIFWYKNLPVHGRRPKPLFGSYPYPTNLLMQQRVEYILVYRREGRRPPVHAENKEASRLSVEQWREYTQNLWSIQTVRANDVHPAMFPPELPRRLIRLYSCVGDTVLDPFMGSGTTCLEARELGRRYVGVDVDRGYVELARRRLAGDPGPGR